MIGDILNRLDKVQKNGPNTWMACCPSHEDRTRSLSVRDDDGKILLNCFAGCSKPDILAALGLDMADLFPPRVHHGRPIRNPFPASVALEALHLESLVVLAAAKAITAHKPITEQDYQRLLLAVERISAGHNAVKPQIRRAA